MNINATWYPPIALQEGGRHNMIFYVNEDIPDKLGCYVFYNIHGKSLTILYVGRAQNLKVRITQQLNNLKLMIGIKKSLTGKKELIYCTINGKSGQKKNKVLDILEKNLVKYAFAEGHELLNIQGTKISYDTIAFTGNRTSEKLFGRTILIQK